ncbi:MAG: ribosome biogenesis GTP-binding protein YihA/YsxC [Lachnospirales bacterium]
MNVNNVYLDKVGVKESQYPESGLPEIAFAGKSNVGKSSLINTMLNRKALARTSGQPGKTRTINFYNLEEQLYFVDLPGYGYAKISKSESEKWGKMIERYLLNRDTLKAIMLLIDIRHEVGQNDKQMFKWLSYYEKDIIIIATKADKIKRSQLPKHLKMLRTGLKLENTYNIIPFSSLGKTGIEEVWSKIDDLIKIK